MPLTFTKNPSVNFDAEEHVYTIQGRPLPGVTAILGARQKPWLGPWMLKSGMEAVRGRWQPGESYTQTAIDAILDESKKAHKKTSQQGKDTGHDVHAWIEAAVRWEMSGGKGGGYPPHAPEIEAPVKAWLEWRSQHDVEWLACEQVVVNETEWYAGTLDTVAKVDGRIGLGDWKSSKTWSEDWGLQTGAYKWALMDMGAAVGRGFRHVGRNDAEATG